MDEEKNIEITHMELKRSNIFGDINGCYKLELNFKFTKNSTSLEEIDKFLKEVQKLCDSNNLIV